MNGKRDFGINLVRLEYGKHHYNYVVDNAFFSLFEQDIISKGQIAIDLHLDKGDALIELGFKFEGYVSLVCDRSLEEFDHQISVEKRVYLKFGEEYAELNDELIQIPVAQQEFNIAQLIFEFITLEIPAKRVHPKFDNDEDFFFSTHNEDEDEEDEEIKSEEVDPRWKDLLKLKGKK